MATRFSFLRFPQSKSLWIPLLTLLDNLLLTVGHHSHLPPAFQGHTSGQAQPSAHLGIGRRSRYAKNQLVDLCP